MELFNFRTIFPNLHLLVNLDTALVAKTSPSATNEDEFNKFGARIFIYRPLQTKILASLLAYPINWKNKSAPLYLPVKALFSITVWARGVLIGESSQSDTAVFQNHSKDVTIEIRDDWESDRQLAQTIGELNKLGPIALKNASPSRPGTRERLASLNVVTNGQATINAWIKGVSIRFEVHCGSDWFLLLSCTQLPNMLSIQPHVAITVHIVDEMSRAKFQELIQAAACAYGSVWNVVKQDYKGCGNGAPVHVFYMECPLSEIGDADNGEEEDWEDDQGDGPRDITLTGSLDYVRSTGSFVAKIVEIDEATGEQEETFSEAFAGGRNGS